MEAWTLYFMFLKKSHNVTSVTRVCSKLLQEAHLVVKGRRKLHQVSFSLYSLVTLKVEDLWPCVQFSQTSFQTSEAILGDKWWKSLWPLTPGVIFIFQNDEICYWMFSWWTIKTQLLKVSRRRCFASAEVSDSKGEGKWSNPARTCCHFLWVAQQARGWQHTGYPNPKYPTESLGQTVSPSWS